MASYDAVSDVLKDAGFGFDRLTDTVEVDALFLKPRPGRASIYVTVPFDGGDIASDVIDQIMTTAGIQNYGSLSGK